LRFLGGLRKRWSALKVTGRIGEGLAGQKQASRELSQDADKQTPPGRVKAKESLDSLSLAQTFGNIQDSNVPLPSFRG